MPENLDFMRSNCRIVVFENMICDTMFYMGVNDTDTANQISIRCNKPLPAVLNMQLGIHRSIRRGSIPHLVCTKDISSYKICENDRI